MQRLNDTPPSKQARRWLAYFVWALIALAFLAFFLLDSRLDYLQLREACQGPDCNWMALTPAEVQALASRGLSTRVYAAFMVGVAGFTVAFYWFLSGFVLWRLGTTRIGLFVSLVLLVVPVTMISDSSNLYIYYPNLQVPWVLLSSLGMIFMLFFVYLFPNGSFYPRWATLSLAGAIVITLLSSALELREPSPFSPLQVSLLLAVLALGFLGLGFQIHRYLRKSSLVERQQTKWALLGIIILIISIPIWILFFGGGLNLPPGGPRLLGSIGGWILINLMGIALPISLAIAMLRYRLWNIDLIIRRTLVYSALTAVLVFVYFGVVTLTQRLFEGLTGEQSPVAIVLSTLTIAALFTPLRRGIQNTIDQRFYRRKYDAERTLQSFVLRARDQTDLDSLTAELLHVVEETLQPEGVSLWLTTAVERPRKQTGNENKD